MQSAQQSRQSGGSSGLEQFGGQIPGGGPQAMAAEAAARAIRRRLQMLTPTEGVDFNDYLQRVVASVKRNWYSVMPESARLGDKGRVILQFRIMSNGSVPDAEPQLEVLLGQGTARSCRIFIHPDLFSI